jgi:hypothetical protein
MIADSAPASALDASRDGYASTRPFDDLEVFSIFIN